MKSSHIIKKSMQMAFAIFINKPIGAIRDIFRARYFGVSVISDAFFMAWRIPNMLRRILTDGAFSSALVPTLIELRGKEGDQAVNKMMTLLLGIMQFFVIIICLIIAFCAGKFLYLFAPGAIDRIAIAIPLLQILIFFTIFMSSATILGGALQTKNNFVIGPMSQSVLNICLLLEYYMCWYFSLSIHFCALLLTLNGLIILLMHYYSYKKAGFIFEFPNQHSYRHVWVFLKRVIPAILTSGVSEINIVVDQAVASYLPIGSQTLLDYAATFIRIPIQVFGSAFSTVIAPVMAKVVLHNPRRVGFYLMEVTKLSLFLAIPSMILIYLFAKKLFVILYVCDNFSLENALFCAQLLSVFSWIIYCSIMNKFLVTVFYAFKHFTRTTVASLLSSAVNIVLNIIMMNFYGLKGIIVATILSEFFRYGLFLYWIKHLLHVPLHGNKLLLFVLRVCVHVLCSLLCVGGFYLLLVFSMKKLLSDYVIHILFDTLVYFLWVGLIMLGGFLFHYVTMPFFSIHLFFLRLRKK